MEKPEITAGIRSALNRGYSIDIAMRSFINAGYSAKDVEDSAASLNNGIISASTTPLPAIEESEGEIKRENEQKYPPLPTIASQIKQKNTDYYSEYPSDGQRAMASGRKRDIVMICLLAVFFLIVLGILLLLIFSRETIDVVLTRLGINAVLNGLLFFTLFSAASKN